MYGPDGMPSIDDLTGPEPERAPNELAARVRAYMGEADAPRPAADPAALDTTELRRELGL